MPRNIQIMNWGSMRSVRCGSAVKCLEKVDRCVRGLAASPGAVSNKTRNGLENNTSKNGLQNRTSLAGSSVEPFRHTREHCLHGATMGASKDACTYGIICIRVPIEGRNTCSTTSQYGIMDALWCSGALRGPSTKQPSIICGFAVEHG